MKDLSDLPVELSLDIIRRLPAVDRHHLSLTSRYFHDVVGPIRLGRQDTFTLRLDKEQSDPDRYLRLCSKCLRLQQFYHYSLNQASASTKPEKRWCLDCYVKGRDKLNLNQLIAWIYGTTISVCTRCGLLVRCYDEAGEVTSRSRHIGLSYILPHPCRSRVGQLAVEKTHLEPMVNKVRERLDRIEARLPKKRLLTLRPKMSGHSPYRDDLDSLMDRLEVLGTK